MEMRTQMIALALVAPAWLVTANAAEHEGQQMQSEQQMQQQQMQGQAGSELMNMTAGEIADMALRNDQGQEIGDIEKVVQSKSDGKVHAIVSLGGFLGLGEKQVAVPLDQVQVQQGELIALGMTKDQLEQQQAYNDEDYEVIEENATLASVTGGAVAGEATQVSFQELDQDQDGNLSREEIQSGPQQLSQNWQQYDTDQDQQLSQSEFSAFEQEQQQPGQMQQQPMEQQQMEQQQMQQGQPGMQQEQVSFQQLDTDQDGNLTPQEIQSGPQQLSQNWQQYDTDQDNQLSQSEFSAFEQQQQQQQPGQVPGQMPESQMPEEGMSPEGQM